MENLAVVVTLSLLLLGCKSPPSLDKDPTPAATPAPTSAAAPTPATDPGPGETQAPQVALAPSARPLYYPQALTPADLEGRTLRELSLMRNTIFARAGNHFRKKWLHDYFTAQSWYQQREELDNSKITELDRKNAHAIATIEASIDRSSLERRSDELLASLSADKPTAEQEIELRLLSRSMGQWIGGKAKLAKTIDPLEDPELLEALLSVAQLDNLSRRDLRLLRNTIYARRGNDFNSDLLTEYFMSTSWYKVNYEYTDKLLTSVDWKNIKLIKSVEESLGGPLADKDHMVKEGWFSAA